MLTATVSVVTGIVRGNIVSFSPIVGLGRRWKIILRSVTFRYFSYLRRVKLSPYWINLLILTSAKSSWQLGRNLSGRSIVGNIFKGERWIRKIPTTFLQIFCKIILHSKVIIKNIIDPDKINQKTTSENFSPNIFLKSSVLQKFLSEVSEGLVTILEELLSMHGKTRFFSSLQNLWLFLSDLSFIWKSFVNKMSIKILPETQIFCIFDAILLSDLWICLYSNQAEHEWVNPFLLGDFLDHCRLDLRYFWK